jgi:catechol 2,3-dioxygenase
MNMSKINESLIGEQHFKISSSMKIGYVSLNVSNFQRSLDFYEKILGFKVIRRISDERVLLSIDGNSSPHLIELLKAKENIADDTFNPLVPATRRAGLYHIAILHLKYECLEAMLDVFLIA